MTVQDLRDPRIDMSRGVAMILVVLGHSLVGMRAALGDPPVLQFAIVLIYTSHMALFFEISGALSRNRAARPWSEFAHRTAWRLLWPYLLWSLVLYSAHFAMSDYTNTALERYRPLAILWQPPSVMWFLYALFAGLLLLRLLDGLPRAGVALTGVAIMAAAYGVDAVPLNARFTGLFMVFAAGQGEWRDRALAPLSLGLAALVMGVTVCMAWQVAGLPRTGYPAAEPRFIPALLAGPLLIHAACHALGTARPGGAMSRGLAHIGRNTMPIFVTHILITAGGRIALHGIGVQSWWVIVGLCTILGIALPLAAAYTAERLGLSRALGWK